MPISVFLSSSPNSYDHIEPKMKRIGGELTMICHSEVPPSGVPHCQHIPDMDSPPYLIRPDRYDVKDKIHVAEIHHQNGTLSGNVL